MNTIFTIGHSNRELPVFLDLLKRNAIELVIDVRKMPRSRSNPQFNAEDLFKDLNAEGIAYTHMEALTGFRSRTKFSINTAWENKSFQAFAAYMLTPEFNAGIDKLLELADKRTAAIMCSEAVWWRCHRRLIADALIARRREVRHILSQNEPLPHQLTDIARLVDGHVEYPPIDI